MIFISILILIVAIALPAFKKQFSPILFTRISSIIFLYAGALSLNAFYIQSIGSGIGIYSGLFHVTIVSQLSEVFLLIIGSLILISWPLNFNNLFHIGDLNSGALPRFRTRLNNFSNLIKKSNLINLNYYSNSAFLSNNYQLKEENQREAIELGNDIADNRRFEVKEIGSKIINKFSNGTEYSLIVIFSTLGASLLISSSDLISMYLSIELQSFGLYILATLYRNSESATSAGLKYFLLGGLSSCLILLGAGLIYSFTGLTNFESIYNIISVSNYNNIIQSLSLGFILIIVGFLFKIGAAPLHFWAPDVYDDSPTIVTIWLTIIPKISIIILLLELQTQIGINIFIVENTIYMLKNILLISSLLSLIIGTIVGLAQIRIKRLLAYSTISHIGFILLALGINTEQSIDSLIFYITQYTLTNLNTFLIIIALGYCFKHNSNNQYRISQLNLKNLILKNKDGRYKSEIESEKDINFISELKGQFYSNPLLSLSLTICLFSMAGVPPLIGFFSKLFVLYSAIQNGYYFMSTVAILVSVISASYYLKIIRVLHTELDELDLKTDSNLINKNLKVENNSAQIAEDLDQSLLTNFHSFLISTLTLTILLFVLKPSIILNTTQLLSLSLYNF